MNPFGDPKAPPLPVLPFAELRDSHGGLHQPALGGSTDNTSGRGCAYNEESNFGLGYAWQAYEGNSNLRTRMPQSALEQTNREASHQFALVLDWEHENGTTIDSTYGGAFLLQHGSYLDGETPCSSVESNVRGFLEPPRLQGQAAVANAPGDINGDGYVEDGGYYALNAAFGRSVQVSWDTVGLVAGISYVLRIENPPNLFDPVLFVGASETALSHGVDYLQHREEDGALWVYINRPVDSDGLNIVFP